MTIYHESAARKVRDFPVSGAELEARAQLAACYRIFNHLGWVEMIFNHITLRVPGPEKFFLINPFGLHYSEISASSLVLIDIDGNPVRESKWPVNKAGFIIHSAIHGEVENAHCVMHTHTTTGMAVACQKDGLSPTNFYAAQLHGGVAYHDFEGITVEEGEKARLVASIGSRRAFCSASNSRSKNSVRRSSARCSAPAQASNQPGWSAYDSIMCSSVTACASSHAMWMSKNSSSLSGIPAWRRPWRMIS